jgi:hypothetical protein
MGRPTNSKYNRNLFNKVEKDLKVYQDYMTKEFLLAVERAFKELAEEALKVTMDKYVPVDEGDLRDSGKVNYAKWEGSGKFVVQVTFGNEQANYAYFVHENMPSGVPKSYTKSGTGPKYLEKGMYEVFTQVNINAAMKRQMKKIR